MDNFCVIKNRSASVIVYSIPELGVRRSFAPGESKKITFEEIEKLTYQPGGMNILTRFLQIQSDDVLNNIGAHVEPEYHMSENDVKNLLMSGSLDQFLDVLDFAPDGVIDLVKRFSVELPLQNLEKRKALKEKIGLDVDAALRHREEEKEDSQDTILKTAPQRRVQPEATAPGRRTATPNYKTVTILNKPAND